MDPNRLRELLEAFPPGMPEGNDGGLDMADSLAVREAAAADPRIGAEVARVQAWDASLLRAMEDVPVPAGLAERLISAVKSQEAAEMVTPAAVVAKTADVKPAVQRGVPRRTWLMSLAAAAAVMAVAVFGGSYAWLLSGPSAVAIVEEARKLWAVQIDASWESVFSVASLEDYPWSGRLQVATVTGWQKVSTKLDENAVVYKLAIPNGRRAMLLVMRSPRAINGLLARDSDSSTAGICIGTWQEGELVYVLMVEGNQQDYERLLQDAAIT